MDISLAAVIVLVTLAVVSVISLLIFRWKNRIRIKGPFDTSLEIEGSNENTRQMPAIRATNVESRRGGLTAHDSSGEGIEIENVKVQEDIDLRTEKLDEKFDPKA